MLGFQTIDSARVILGGSEMIHMMRKQQAKYAWNLQPSLAEQFEMLAASSFIWVLSPFCRLVKICDRSFALRS